MRKYLTLILLAAFGIFAYGSQPAPDSGITPGTRQAVPNLIRYTGQLLGPDGSPLAGAHDVLFSLYATSQGGTPLWQEAQSVTADATGHYTAVLGVTSPRGIPAALFATATSRWLDLYSPDAAPAARAMLVSVPYALKAHDADSVGGIPASQIARLLQAQTTPGGVTPADLATETTLRQQADTQVLQQAEQYADNVVANANANTAALSAVAAETIRARASEGLLGVTSSAEAARAQSAEAVLTAAVADAAAPKIILSGSPTPPAGYLFSGLTMQATGSPTPEALIALSLANVPGQSSYTLYLHIKN